MPCAYSWRYRLLVWKIWGIGSKALKYSSPHTIGPCQWNSMNPIMKKLMRLCKRCVHSFIQREAAPLPFEDDPRCMRCSHVGICLAEERVHDLLKHHIYYGESSRSCGNSSGNAWRACIFPRKGGKSDMMVSPLRFRQRML